MTLALWIMGFQLGSGLLGLMSLRGGGLQRGLDHPASWRRYLSRALAFCACNFFSFFLSPALYGWLLPSDGTKIEPGWPAEIVLLLAPLPLAIVLYGGLVRFLRWGARRERSTARRLGLLPPIRQRPVAPASDTGKPDFRHMDINDPELVRELARRHWNDINHAVASEGDLASAGDAQRRFLDEYVPTLAPDTAKAVTEVYAQESVAHAAELSRITRMKAAQAERQAEIKKRMARNAYLLGGIVLLMALASLVFKLLSAS